MNSSPSLKKKTLYKIWIKKSAQKSVRSLPKEQILSIVANIHDLSANPRPTQSKKLKGSINYYRLRKGNYRILYAIDEQAKEIIIYKVKHRKDVYR